MRVKWALSVVGHKEIVELTAIMSQNDSSVAAKETKSDQQKLSQNLTKAMKAISYLTEAFRYCLTKEQISTHRETHSDDKVLPLPVQTTELLKGQCNQRKETRRSYMSGYWRGLETRARKMHELTRDV